MSRPLLASGGSRRQSDTCTHSQGQEGAPRGGGERAWGPRGSARGTSRCPQLNCLKDAVKRLRGLSGTPTAQQSTAQYSTAGYLIHLHGEQDCRSVGRGADHELQQSRGPSPPPAAAPARQGRASGRPGVPGSPSREKRQGVVPRAHAPRQHPAAHSHPDSPCPPPPGWAPLTPSQEPRADAGVPPHTRLPQRPVTVHAPAPVTVPGASLRAAAPQCQRGLPPPVAPQEVHPGRPESLRRGVPPSDPGRQQQGGRRSTPHPPWLLEQWQGPGAPFGGQRLSLPQEAGRRPERGCFCGLFPWSSPSLRLWQQIEAHRQRALKAAAGAAGAPLLLASLPRPTLRALPLTLRWGLRPLASSLVKAARLGLVAGCATATLPRLVLCESRGGPRGRAPGWRGDLDDARGGAGPSSPRAWGGAGGRRGLWYTGASSLALGVQGTAAAGAGHLPRAAPGSPFPILPSLPLSRSFLFPPPASSCPRGLHGATLHFHGSSEGPLGTALRRARPPAGWRAPPPGTPPVHPSPGPWLQSSWGGAARLAWHPRPPLPLRPCPPGRLPPSPS